MLQIDKKTLQTFKIIFKAHKTVKIYNPEFDHDRNIYLS